METTQSIPQTATLLFQALDAAERALWPDGRTHCAGCATYGAACLDVAGAEEEGRYLVPVACGVCGGWRTQEEPARVSFEDACYLALLEDDAALAPLPSGDGRWTLGRVR